MPSLSSDDIGPVSAESPISPEGNDDEKRDYPSLFKQSVEQQQQCVYAKNGYKKLGKISRCLQGDMYKALNQTNGEYVAIKRASKELLDDNIAFDDDGMTFCVSENLVKEAAILQYLTVRNRPLGDYIVNFVDLFEDDEDYFLVLEYIESETNLQQFVQEAHEYLKKGQLPLKAYQKAIKYIMWQLVVTVKWLHDDMHCCHLDLCVENIMLKNCDFIQKKNGMIVNPKLTVKICDFGVSEVMKRSNFECRKFGLSLDNEAYVSPKAHAEQTYDARSSDVWSLGMILFECLSGTKPYDPCEIWMAGQRGGYWAVQHDFLKTYLVKMKLIKYWTNGSLSLLLSLLQCEESKRCDVKTVFEHVWFRAYFENYHQRIKEKSIVQRHQLLSQTPMGNFPFYLN